MNCVTVATYIEWAYIEFAQGQRAGFGGPKRLPKEGLPAWTNSDRYTIAATTESNASPEMMQGPMLQAILEDRFQLKTHIETREIPVYELTMAKGGLKMHRAEEGSCTPRDPTNLTGRLDPGEKPYCGQAATNQKGANAMVDLRSATLDGFSRYLKLNRPIIDKTGVAGKFDFKLEFALDETTVRRARDDVMQMSRHSQRSLTRCSNSSG